MKKNMKQKLKEARRSKKEEEEEKMMKKTNNRGKEMDYILQFGPV